jgi:hypothetical protein
LGEWLYRKKCNYIQDLQTEAIERIGRELTEDEIEIAKKALYENYSCYHFVANESLGVLYAAEKNLKELRYEIGL